MIKTRRRRVVVTAGDQYAQLTVSEEVGPRILSGKPCRQLRCTCECGNEKIVLLKDIRSGSVKSCGCLHDTLPIKHGQASNDKRSLTYRSWSNIRRRCLNPNAHEYDSYGGSGIRICDRWSEFSAFLEDMGERPSVRHSIDRYPDQEGNYEPGNCRWATPKQQGRNRNNNRMLTFNGETMCLSEWAEKIGMSAAALKCRLDICGYTIEEALTFPVGTRRA